MGSEGMCLCQKNVDVKTVIIIIITIELFSLLYLYAVPLCIGSVNSPCM